MAAQAAQPPPVEEAPDRFSSQNDCAFQSEISHQSDDFEARRAALSSGIVSGRFSARFSRRWNRHDTRLRLRCAPSWNQRHDVH